MTEKVMTIRINISHQEGSELTDTLIRDFDNTISNQENLEFSVSSMEMDSNTCANDS